MLLGETCCQLNTLSLSDRVLEGAWIQRYGSALIFINQRDPFKTSYNVLRLNVDRYVCSITCRTYSFCVKRIGSNLYSIHSCIAFLKLIEHAIPQTDLVNAGFLIFLEESKEKKESRRSNGKHFRNAARHAVESK